MADRPTASRITDDQLDALYAELDQYVLREIDRTDGEQDQRLAGHGVLHGLAGVARRRTEQRDRARTVAVALENENARLEAELDATFLHKKKQELHERAERAEQQLANVRALHTSSQETRGVGRGSPWRPFCDHCHQDWPCATIRALDGAQQPATGEAGDQ